MVRGDRIGSTRMPGSTRRWTVRITVRLVALAVVLPLFHLWYKSIRMFDASGTIGEPPVADEPLHSIAASSPLPGSWVPHACRDKLRLVQILLDAGVSHRNITSQLCQRLPTWSQVVDLYGDAPVMVGLEAACPGVSTPTDSPTRHNPPWQPRVAGMFHTGTNVLAQLLMQQEQATVAATTHRQTRRVTRNYRDYDVPYGKHAPYAFRTTVTMPENLLIIVLIRDPFRWMRKMCQVRYDATWERSRPHRCPNLVQSIGSPTTRNGTVSDDRQQMQIQVTTYPVTVRIVGSASVNISAHHDSLAREIVYPSLADWWSLWNREYYDQARKASRTTGNDSGTKKQPRLLMVRFEDLLFFAPQVMHMIRDCVGWSASARTKQAMHTSDYLLNAAKSHGWSSDLVTALIRYGSPQGRYKGLAPVDREYLQSALDPELLRVFHYPQVPV